MIAALALLAAMQAAPVEGAIAAPKQYVTHFCAPIVMGEPDAGALRQHYADWGAKLAPDTDGALLRPADVEAPGQMVGFADAAAPHAFVERRRGFCSLVYPGAHASSDLMSDLQTGGIIIGRANDKPTLWRRITTKRVGRPGPMRYFLPANDEARFGLCATLFEDLRLHDETPATLVRVETCRISPEDTFD
ncbi:MAG: hypothetical protein M3N05_02240 [Pseudomonadota bacterium]|nr:hypothetical protein [Pseudomonadota bacterium]